MLLQGLIQAICLVVPSVLSLLLLLSVSNGEEITPLFDDIELGEEGGQRHDHSKKHKTSDTKRWVDDGLHCIETT